MGILGHFQNHCIVVNRTTGAGQYEQVLNVRYDGEDYTLPPGESVLPIVAASYAKAQNVLKGSRHPSDPRRAISLVGIKGKDDCEPIPEEVLAAAEGKFEAADRSGEFWGEELGERKLLRKKGFDAYDAMASIPSTYDVNRNIE